MTSVHQEQGYGGSSQPVTVNGESRSGWFPPQVADQATGKEAAAGQPASLLNCFLIHEIILSSIQLYQVSEHFFQFINHSYSNLNII